MIQTEALLRFAREPLEIGRPAWLGSAFHDPIWIVRDTSILDDRIQRRRKSTAINFNFMLPDGRTLLDPIHVEKLNAIRWILLLARRGGNASHGRALIGAGTPFHLSALASVLFTITHFLMLHDCERFQDCTGPLADRLVELATGGISKLLDIEKRMGEWLDTDPRIPVIGKQGAASTVIVDMDEVSRQVRIGKYTFCKSKTIMSRLLSAAEKQGAYVAPIAKRRAAEKKTGIASETRIVKLVRALRALYLIRDFGVSEEDGVDLLTFLPWPGQDDFAIAKAAVARARARLDRPTNIERQRSGRTASISADSGLLLINAAIEYVDIYGEKLVSAKEELSEQAERLRGEEIPRYRFHKALHKRLEAINQKLGEGGGRCPWPFLGIGKSMRLKTNPRLGSVSIGDNGRGYSPSFREAVDVFLPAACFIVLASFTARRVSELQELAADCLSGPPTNRYIEIYSAKYLKALELFPVVPIVERVVAILLRWSSDARRIADSDRIFDLCFPYDYAPKVMSFRSAVAMRAFTKFVGVKAESVSGKEVALSNHQFRRLFANLFLYRFAPGARGKLEALTHQLRHMSPAVTEIYVREVVSGQVFDAAQLEMSAGVLTDVMLGRINASGGISQRFGRMAKVLGAHYRATLTLVDAQKSRQMYESWIAEKVLDRVFKVHLAISPLPWGYCFGSSIPLRRMARCNAPQEREKLKEPNFVNATIETCINCPNMMRLDSHLPCLESIQSATETALKNANSKILLSACRAHAELVRTALLGHAKSGAISLQDSK